MSVHAYPLSAAIADGGRAGLGIAIVGMPLLFAPLAPEVTVLLALLLIAFLGLGAAALRRCFGGVEIDADGIAVNGRRLAWPALKRIRLAYFSTRRDGGSGWFQLRLASDEGELTIFSAVDGFAEIAQRTALAAIANGVAVDDVTRANFAALAITVPGEEE